ncbi:MAG: BMP family ABC transporter substrate-binding protein [Metamycoplasmataceae bacterium]
MNLVKKILLGGALITLAASASTFLVSCSSSVKFDLGISEETENYYGKKLKEKLSSSSDKSEVQRKTVLITAEGTINDKSFNESALGAIKLYQRQINSNNENFTYKETKNVTQLDNLYTESLNQGFKTWVLTGFQHQEQFDNWLNKGSNRQKFIGSRVVIIGVDWDGSDIVPQGQFLGLGFKTEEAAWVVGQAASEYLYEKGLPPHLNTFGGGEFDGVTDFINGFLQGMLDWNIENESKKVEFWSGNSQSNNIVLYTGFAPDPFVVNTISDILGTMPQSPRIILPVAGSLTNTTLNDVKNKNNDQLLIGVDSNQALAFPKDKKWFFSSIEKKVALGIYKAMVLLAGIPLDHIEAGVSDVGFQGDFSAAGVAGGSNKNAYVKYGFDKNLVSVSKSLLEGDDADIANKALKSAMLKFQENPPQFKVMTNSMKNEEILNGIIKSINLNDKFDIGISKATEDYYGRKLEDKLASTTDKTEIQRKTVLITAEGVVNDKAFNESALGAIRLYQKQVQSNNDTFTYRETTSVAQLDNLYTQSLNQGFKTWVLTGFQQEAEFAKWIDKGNNRAAFIASEAVIIGVDWNGSSIVPEGQFLGLGFKTEEASWVVGQAAAEYLHEKGLPPHLNTFGGGEFDGVTDFINGFLQGMLDWNIENESKKVEFWSGNSQSNSVILDTGFAPDPAIINKINNIVGTTSQSPKIILPVAGSLTGTTLENVKDKKNDQLLIGVDSNQTLAFPNDKEWFFSSVEKKVAVGIYKAMVLLAGIPLDHTEAGVSDLGFQGDFSAAGVAGGTNKNAYVKYGFDKDLVGVSQSLLKGNDANIANRALVNAIAKFKSNPPSFQPMTNPIMNEEILNNLIMIINRRNII